MVQQEVAPVHHFGGRGGAQIDTKWSTRYKSLYLYPGKVRALISFFRLPRGGGVFSLTKAEKGAFERSVGLAFCFFFLFFGSLGGAILRLVEGV